MTNPGEIEKVPLKVVPIYIDPVPYEEELDPEPVEPQPEPAAEDSRSSMLGQLVLLAAIATLVVHMVAIAVASSGAWATGTVLAWVAIGMSALSVIGGVVAVILNRGRRWAIAAIVLGVVANPLIVLWVLRALGGLEA